MKLFQTMNIHEPSWFLNLRDVVRGVGAKRTSTTFFTRKAMSTCKNSSVEAWVDNGDESTASLVDQVNESISKQLFPAAIVANERPCHKYISQVCTYSVIYIMSLPKMA